MSASAVVDRLGPGDHVAWLFDDDEGYFDVIARYTQTGVGAQHQMVYLVHAHQPRNVIDALADRGIDVEGTRFVSR